MDEAPCAFLWCFHCGRAYRWGEYREIGGLQMCPYMGCNGDTVMDGWRWDEVREGKPRYPKKPKLGHVYELNRTLGNTREEFLRFQQISKYTGGLVPQAQAAAVLGLSKQRINALIADGRLREHDFFGKNFISCRDLEEFQKEKRSGGRPKKTIDKSKQLGSADGRGSGAKRQASEKRRPAIKGARRVTGFRKADEVGRLPNARRRGNRSVGASVVAGKS